MSYSKIRSKIPEKTVILSERDDALLNKLISIMQDKNNTKKCKHHSNEYYLLTKVLERNDFKNKLFRVMTSNSDVIYRRNHNELETFNPYQDNCGLVIKLIRALCSMYEIVYGIKSNTRFFIGSLSGYKTALIKDIKKKYDKNIKNDLKKLFLLHNNHINHINGKCLNKDEVHLLVCGFLNKNNIGNKTNYNQDIENEIVSSVGFCNVNLM